MRPRNPLGNSYKWASGNTAVQSYISVGWSEGGEKKIHFSFMFAHLVQRQVKDVSQCLHCTVSQTKLFNNPSTGQTQTTNQTQAV